MNFDPLDGDGLKSVCRLQTTLTTILDSSLVRPSSSGSVATANHSGRAGRDRATEGSMFHRLWDEVPTPSLPCSGTKFLGHGTCTRSRFPAAKLRTGDDENSRAPARSNYFWQYRYNYFMENQ